MIGGSDEQGQLILKILRGKYPPLPGAYSSGLARLLDACLTADTRRRPAAADILRCRERGGG